MAMEGGILQLSCLSGPGFLQPHQHQWLLILKPYQVDWRSVEMPLPQQLHGNLFITDITLEGRYQIFIPSGLKNLNVSVTSFNNHTNLWDFNPCSYAFVADKSLVISSSARMATVETRIFSMVAKQELNEQQVSIETIRIFSVEELNNTTKNYDESHIIGKGGFGVYKDDKVAKERDIEQIKEVYELAKRCLKVKGCCEMVIHATSHTSGEQVKHQKNGKLSGGGLSSR
ncbi:hypothetical protein GOBAR_AA06072 [Gossypium barbadense]|uniref:Uncharacterized protein n=1 Tax=Gossypium barbadense TaxID=3634 RepID=A0A2P5YFZ3_GOSBA|nr:hypothetical protein GOBAR_AA06072 [Gossypium barbadense]